MMNCSLTDFNLQKYTIYKNTHNLVMNLPFGCYFLFKKNNFVLYGKKMSYLGSIDKNSGK